MKALKLFSVLNVTWLIVMNTSDTTSYVGHLWINDILYNTIYFGMPNKLDEYDSQRLGSGSLGRRETILLDAKLTCSREAPYFIQVSLKPNLVKFVSKVSILIRTHLWSISEVFSGQRKWWNCSYFEPSNKVLKQAYGKHKREIFTANCQTKANLFYGLSTINAIRPIHHD